MATVATQHRRVAITGLGVICPLGNSVDALWDALSAGRSGIGRLSQLPPLEDRLVFGGEAREFSGHIDDFGPLSKDRRKAIRKALKVMCRETMMAVAAAQHAIADAGYCDAPMDPETSGVVFGSDYMLSSPEDFIDGMTKCGARSGKFDYPRWGDDGLGEMNPLWMLKYLPNMPGSHIAIFNDLRGPNNSLTLREISGLMAIREAARTIERGHADRMIAGATGTRIHSFKSIHALQQEQLANPNCPPAEAARPFDSQRSGMVVGEGAGAVVLEDLEIALRNGATIYGEVVGTGSSTVADANLNGQPAAALANAARTALAESRVPLSELGHVNAHGLGTTASDQIEARSLNEVLGQHIKSIPVVAPKSYFGNLGAGSGVVELVTSVKAMEQRRLFRTLNYEAPDPGAPPLAIAADANTPAGDSFLKVNITPQAQAVALVVARPGR
ncbi:MAG: beta-ketoacyl-[acyl-carrier-protein] synthase family protein [Pirellulales bacterium]|nr:beta-ketoacyl-[acyl-carrier-protein] synthase family protein [Pirellulales bacterium]